MCELCVSVVCGVCICVYVLCVWLCVWFLYVLCMFYVCVVCIRSVCDVCVLCTCVWHVCVWCICKLYACGMFLVCACSVCLAFHLVKQKFCCFFILAQTSPLAKLLNIQHSRYVLRYFPISGSKLDRYTIIKGFLGITGLTKPGRRDAHKRIFLPRCKLQPTELH